MEQWQQERVLRLPWMRSVYFSGWILLSTSHPIFSKDLTLKFNLHNAYGSLAGICSMLSLLHSQASMSTAVHSHVFTHVCLHHYTASSSKIMTLPTPAPEHPQSNVAKPMNWKINESVSTTPVKGADCRRQWVLKVNLTGAFV